MELLVDSRTCTLNSEGVVTWIDETYDDEGAVFSDVKKLSKEKTLIWDGTHLKAVSNS